ncbi:MAG: MoxR family ATPase [Bacillota bacterium]|nr:MoxR family ATPase [Bacillota bacterium]
MKDKIRNNVEKVIIGKSDIIDLLLTSMISGGHVLLEDVPGTGKTVLAKTIARSVGVDFKRIQFTPDLLPSDLTGINYFNQKQGEFVFRQGPIFTNILLGDEINRATPRTQSSLLECMEEKQITVDGTTYKLTEPFFVIATENPVENQGTFPLPEAQLDRFLMKVSMGYPSMQEGKEIFKRFMLDNPLDKLEAVCTMEELLLARAECQKIHVNDDVQEYMLNIIEETRKHDSISLGVSPRGSLALLKSCQVYAAIMGRNYVTPEDVKYIVPHVLGHRIILRDNLRIRGVKSVDILKEMLDKVVVPTENWN